MEGVGRMYMNICSPAGALVQALSRSAWAGISLTFRSEAEGVVPLPEKYEDFGDEIKDQGEVWRTR